MRLNIVRLSSVEIHFYAWNTTRNKILTFHSCHRISQLNMTLNKLLYSIAERKKKPTTFTKE